MANNIDTYLLDLDGCLVEWQQNPGPEFKFLPGSVENLVELVISGAYIVLTTARSEAEAKPILDALWDKHGFEFEQCIYNLPHGRRFLINDTSANGECRAFAISHKRDSAWSK